MGPWPKAAADMILSQAWPFERYSTDCFRREDDKKLWDPRYGMRKHGAIAWTAAGTMAEAYRDGDELVWPGISRNVCLKWFPLSTEYLRLIPGRPCGRST